MFLGRQGDRFSVRISKTLQVSGYVAVNCSIKETAGTPCNSDYTVLLPFITLLQHLLI